MIRVCTVCHRETGHTLYGTPCCPRCFRRFARRVEIGFLITVYMDLLRKEHSDRLTEYVRREIWE